MLSLNNEQFALLLLLAGGATWWLYHQGKTSLNPTDRGNIVHQGVNAIGDVFDDGLDNNSFNLGRELFYFLNPDVRRLE